MRTVVPTAAAPCFALANASQKPATASAHRLASSLQPAGGARVTSRPRSPPLSVARLSPAPRHTGGVRSTRTVTCAAAAEQTEGSESEAPVRLKWYQKHMHENMVDISGTANFLEEMGNAGEQLVIVDFYAAWCHACKGLYPKLAKLMEENPDIKLLKVEFESNRELCKSLGVKVLPYFHFYRGNEGRVAAFSASLKKINRLKEAIAEHNAPRCALGDLKVYSTVEDVVQSAPEEEQEETKK